MDGVDGAGRQNRLLAALPDEEYQRLLPSLRAVQVATGQVLVEPRDKMEYAYFPLEGVLCLLMLMEDGTVIEVATVGHEGFVDVTALLSVDTSPYEVLCQEVLCQSDCRTPRVSVDSCGRRFATAECCGSFSSALPAWCSAAVVAPRRVRSFTPSSNGWRGGCS